ncbi:MAG TPA: NHL repeat-containing protein [Bacteroidota bacterium]|nr:NHL repeat-containing protein [Bacteroidota bacterium]
MGTVLTLASLLLFNPAIDSIESLVELTSIGSFNAASRIVIDFRGRIFVADHGTHLVYCFPSFKESPLTVGGYGWTDGAFDTPTDVATDGVNIYVTDYGNHRVQKFDQKLRFVGSWSGKTATHENERFGYPKGIALSEIGEVFLLDGENNRVIKYSTIGKFERAFGNITTNEGRLTQPKRLLLRGKEIFVLENSRVVVYDVFGAYLRTIGENQFCDARGVCCIDPNLFVATQDTLYSFSKEGKLCTKTPRTVILASSPIEEITDIASYNRTLYLLTPNSIRIFEIQNK